MNMPLSKPVVEKIIASLVEVFSLFSSVNIKSLFKKALKEIRSLFINVNINSLKFNQYEDDIFNKIKSIRPRDKIEVFLCSLMVVAWLFGIYEYLRDKGDNSWKNLLSLYNKCIKQITKNRVQHSASIG